jgi:hypothetical protein
MAELGAPFSATKVSSIASGIKHKMKTEAILSAATRRPMVIFWEFFGRFVSRENFASRQKQGFCGV